MMESISIKECMITLIYNFCGQQKINNIYVTLVQSSCYLNAIINYSENKFC